MNAISRTRNPVTDVTRGRVSSVHTGALGEGVLMLSAGVVWNVVVSEVGCVPWAESGDTPQAEPYSHPALREFAAGKEGNPPTEEANRLAQRIVRTADQKGTHPDILVDFEGALSFDLNLPDGKLLLAYLFPDGVLDVSVYDDATGEWAVNNPAATERDFVGLF